MVKRNIEVANGEAVCAGCLGGLAAMSTLAGGALDLQAER